jgi:predicted regulator of Ras-like GTPase activity (Roadblock/LC7/MglB family)
MTDKLKVAEYRSDTLARSLRDLHTQIEGIRASVIVNIDGLLAAAYPPSSEEDPSQNPTSSPQVAAMAATLLALAERTLDRLAQGDLERLLMEGQHGVMLVLPCGKRAALAVLVDKQTKLGIAFMAASHTAGQVAEVLGD